jgi:hypothetical protein
MMAVADVSWEDQDETLHTARARIEDTSPSGACFRLKVPIGAGTRVHVSWCRDDFSGTARWCHAEDGEYVVGMQRDKIDARFPTRIASRVATRLGLPDAPAAVRPVVARSKNQEEAAAVAAPIQARIQVAIQPPSPVSGAASLELPVPLPREIAVKAPVRTEIQDVPTRRALIRRGTLIPIPKPEPLAMVRITFPAAVVHKPVIGFEIALGNMTREVTAREPTVPSGTYQIRTSSLFEERSDMQNKWLNLGSRRQQEGANGNGAAEHGAGGDAVTPPRGDLLMLEDIYRTAGIMEPRMGYSITKVVEMLKSDHLRGLGDEVKRASVLMALNAAGIPLGDILQDAAHRQSAVAAYEAEQRRKFEEYWTRRAEENSLLQTEMERVTRQYVERMNRNLTEVQQEKEGFQKWQNAMQQEVLRISEAVTLCAQPAVFESATAQAATAGGQSLVAKTA